ncbi:MAG: hypothetical protein K2X34_05750 [Hyphomonadaceae bacterium]|nr:hypothetical protein [Hyphomonadaceae bacterium]MBY0423821.1 hypothetical protein [Parvularculaceae bacterium]
MARTIVVAESAPAAYANAYTVFLDVGPKPEAVWQRIESWIAYRWGERNCVFTVEGPGHWKPPLLPFVASTTEVWVSDAWEATALRPSPFGGFVLESAGPFRITGVLGDAGPLPPAVKEAVFLLSEYLTSAAMIPTRERSAASIEVFRPPLLNEPGEPISSSEPRPKLRIENQNPQWIARALIYSGAADLLRPWRNLGAN